jgi:hypothetical protein
MCNEMNVRHRGRGNKILAYPLEETKAKNTNKATMDMFEENKNQMS